MLKKEIYPPSLNQPEIPPFFNTLSADILKEILTKSLEQKPLYLYTVSRAYVSPFGVVIKNGFLVRESLSPYLVEKTEFYKTQLSFFKKLILRKTHYIHGTCMVITHSWFSNYYHWLIEIIPRLFLLKEDTQNCKLVIHKNLSRFHKDILSKFNFKEIVYLEDDELVECETVLFTSFPNASYFNRKVIKEEKLNLIELQMNQKLMLELKHWFYTKNPLLKEAPPTRKIYLSRRKAPNRQILNESELEAFLIPQGFVKIYLEDYSFDEQIEIIYNCKILIACHGAGLANLLFMQPNSHIINLIAENFYEFCYLSLSKLSDLNYAHIHCKYTGNEPNPAFNDITVDLALLGEVLRKIS